MAAMAVPPALLHVSVDGKFFRLGAEKFFPKGVTYGPFVPSEKYDVLPSPEQAAKDLAQIRDLGANLVRVYHPPGKWFLDLANEHGLRVWVDFPWEKHLCFADSRELKQKARRAVREAVRSCERHPAVFAFCVANEIPADIVRWSGAKAVSAFIDQLVEDAKNVDAEALCTFTSFPPTEFLHSTNIDFVSFNVYLHQQKAFENYLGRLQMIADSKPLVLAEFGIDSIREGEDAKCDIVAWQIETAFRAGLAGNIIFSFTDDWFTDQQQIEDWSFGLTTKDRTPKPSFEVVKRLYHAAPHFPLPRYPKVSVVVASYNGARTLRTCLESLMHLRYPDYEVILVDDGSTDNTRDITDDFANVRYLRQPNLGLSAARNTGIHAATGEVVAFTDSDCRADEDWLHYLIADLLSGGFAGVGGHNFLPPEDSLVATAVMVSPGGPSHVMLTDREAEHLPGCNMAFYKFALIEIGGFDVVFRKAGDDVDVCWRLLERGYKLGFSPAGFVWHYRRSTVGAYLKQQAGYGEAEALLAHKHPEYFSPLGGSIWRGRIYGQSLVGPTVSRPVIYRGLFGSGFFQKLYAPAPAYALMFCTSLEYHVLITLPLLAISISIPMLWPLFAASLVLTFGVCATAAAQAVLPRKKRKLWSRPLVTLLFLLQPVVRGWARYRWRLTVRPQPAARRRAAAAAGGASSRITGTVSYWSETGGNRFAFLDGVLKVLEEEGWQTKLDTGWNAHDVEIYGQKWARVRLTTVTEVLGRGKTIVRGRLDANWSLRAKLYFWVLLALQIVVVALLRDTQPWLWMILLSVPLLGWFFEQQKHHLQAIITTLLDSIASQLDMKKVEHSEVSAPSKTSLATTAP
jgi:O-antigen biosynthesis protein